MFARPYAPPPPTTERTGAPSPRNKGGINSPHAKHFKLFRSLPLSAAVPEASVLSHSYAASRPASAATTPARPSRSLPLTPYAPTPLRPTAPPTPSSAAAAAAAATPRTADSIASPRRGRRPGSAAAIRSAGFAGGQEYQAAFLSALQERQSIEADRLTLFNRLQHLRASEERAERHIEATTSQIRAVQLSRERHAREAAERKANEDWFAASRMQKALAQREQQAQRRAAFEQYKFDLKAMRRAQASLQREEHRELLQHRSALQNESLERAQALRDDLRDRTRLFHERQAMTSAQRAARVLEAKQARIEQERARRAQAEEDLVAMEAEEAALLARAQLRARMHQDRLDELASLVLQDDRRGAPASRPTTAMLKVKRAQYVHPQEQGEETHEPSHFDSPEQGHAAAAADSHSSPLGSSSYTLPLPSAGMQRRMQQSTYAGEEKEQHNEHSDPNRHQQQQQQQRQPHSTDASALDAAVGFALDEHAGGGVNGEEGEVPASGSDAGPEEEEVAAAIAADEAGDDREPAHGSIAS